jgi:acyl-CoA thioesterase FadM
VRFDECGPDGLVRTSTLLRYAQHAAWVHAGQLGIDRDWSRALGLAWVARAAEIAVLRPIAPDTTLGITTRLGGIRKALARRRTEVRLEDGRLAGWGHTDWVVIGERGLPERLPPDFVARFAAVPGAFEPVRVHLPPTPAAASRIAGVVRPQDLDPQAHVNNAAYLDYLEETLLASADPRARAAVAGMPRRVRVEYQRPAGPGAALRGAAWPMDAEPADRPAWAWRLTDDGGTELARGVLDQDDRAIGG